MAVIDVRAVAQLISQLRILQDQLATARQQLTQAQRELQSMSGGRGMEHLLRDLPRNYLPSSWMEIEAMLRESGGHHPAQAEQIRAAIQANAVLTPEQVGALSAVERAQLDAARNAAALRQIMARQALEVTSSRFMALQQLIDAIAAADDQKAILDLQARIAAEQGMLANEQTKLDVLHQAAQAEEWARRQRVREQAIAAVGSFRRLPAMGL